MWVIPERVGDLPMILSSLDKAWWVAGGWAVDLFVGEQTRDHEDLEISVLLRDQDQVREALADWDLCVVDRGQFSPWLRGDVVEPPRHQLWARRSADAPWSLEILFETTDGDEWVFRRDARVRRALSEFGVEVGGLAVVAPEVQLLFKAKAPKAKDEHDFETVRSRLSNNAAAWLRTALQLVHPEHPWIARL